MAVSAFMDAAPLAPAHGDTLTVTYSVTGNDPVAPHEARISGHVIVGGVGYDVGTTITLPGIPAAEVTYETPACEGLAFAGTENPAAFTAVVP